MEKMIDLKDLLKHEILDLYSAEKQIIDALPAMIGKATNDKLKTALKDHLKVTEAQKKRLEEIQQMMGEANEDESAENRGFFSRLFGGEEKCKGMEGLIDEGKKLMGEDMSPEASDAAIIAAAQKIEHYEISGYGTARAYARQLNLQEVSAKLEKTLNEEYEADDLLTGLAVGKVNIEAEFAFDNEQDGGMQKKRKSNGRPNASGISAKSNNGRPGSQSKSEAASSRKGVTKSASRLESSRSKETGRASLRKISASNGRGTASKSASKSKTNNIKAAGNKRSTSKTSSNRRGRSSSGR